MTAGETLRRFGGARSTRVIDRGHAVIAEHAHDWPVLSLYVMGAYANRCALGETHISAPSVVFYAAGAAHANQAGPDGFEQIEVEFDPAWLWHDAIRPDEPVCRRLGGATANAAQALARMWSSPDVSEARLRAATGDLMRSAFAEPPVRRQPWIDLAARRIARDPGVRLTILAAEAGLHPVWLGQAYRAATGESIRRTATRRRTEIAAHLLRETETPAALVALEAGFYDQSHMIRGFRAVLGRTPAQVRADRDRFRALETSNRLGPPSSSPWA
jgi:AraC-like DNA-binding protein